MTTTKASAIFPTQMNYKIFEQRLLNTFRIAGKR